MQVLRMFECAAHHGSFSAAASQLNTTQPAVSRTIAELERKLAIRLFERRHRGVSLTPAGEIYLEIVRAGLSRIVEGGLLVSGLSDDNRVVIACGRATSEMVLRPRFENLRRVLGEDAAVRILPFDYDMLNRLDPLDADIVLTWDAGSSAPGDRVVAFRDAVTPVCSPAYAGEYADTLRRPVTEWGPMTFRYLARLARGWVTWEDWFTIVGRPSPEPRYLGNEDYVQLIDATIAGGGLALGWRHFIERHVEMGMLVQVMDDFVEFDRACYAVLTERGRTRPLARRCLDFFADCDRDAGSHG